jgi:DEAD/DEAH box helicase domain-containing protein
MSNEIVLDIETYGDLKDMSKMKITVVSIYDYATDAYYSFDENQLSNLWTRLEKASRLIGYNSEHFDIPILNRYYAGDLFIIPHLDLLKVIKESAGSRYKLNDIAKATLQMEKLSDGIQAGKWYEEGKIDEIKKYCEQDVKITKEIYEFGKKNKMIYYPTLTGTVMPIPVDFEMPKINTFSHNQQTGLNMTLPL